MIVQAWVKFGEHKQHGMMIAGEKKQRPGMSDVITLSFPAGCPLKIGETIEVEYLGTRHEHLARLRAEIASRPTP